MIGYEEKDEQKKKEGYKFKVFSNMPKFESLYFTEKKEAVIKQSQLLKKWEMINVFVLVIELNKEEE